MKVFTRKIWKPLATQVLISKGQEKNVMDVGSFTSQAGKKILCFSRG